VARSLLELQLARLARVARLQLQLARLAPSTAAARPLHPQGRQQPA
jgi:hypothetical protein